MDSHQNDINKLNGSNKTIVAFRLCKRRIIYSVKRCKPLTHATNLEMLLSFDLCGHWTMFDVLSIIVTETKQLLCLAVLFLLEFQGGCGMT